MRAFTKIGLAASSLFAAPAISALAGAAITSSASAICHVRYALQGQP